MSIDIKIVRKIANLAKIHLEPSQEVALVGELSNIITYVEQLSQVNTDNVEPLTSVLEEEVIWREDQVVHEKLTEQILANAPESKMGFFVVPKVLENS